MEDENEDGWIEVQKPLPLSELIKYVPKFPYPERQQRSKLNLMFQEFLNILKLLTINIPFVEPLEKMSSYARFMKKILSKKKRLEEFQIVALNEECSVVVQSKLPPKMNDLGRFIIPSSIGSKFSPL